MRLFGLTITRTKAALNEPRTGGWHRINEPFAGAWQKNQEITRGSLVTYPTLFACLHRVSSDIGKLPFLLKQESNGIKETVQNPAYAVLNSPNNYQTPQQFREAWILSKLMHGNAYVLKERDNRNVVRRLYVLDPTQVLPKVSDSGDVFYELNYRSSTNLLPSEFGDDTIVVPDSEIIHDRLNCFHHQLIGVPPLASAYWPAVKNMEILKSASDFFSNHSQPGGVLSGPAGMSDEDAEALKQYWNEEFSGKNAGRVAVIGADVKFTPFAMKSADAQLVEQMQWSDRQICQPFGVPPFIVGLGDLPAGMKADDMASVYYRFALQALIESMENTLTLGLGITGDLSVELDVHKLLRMDTEKRGTVMGQLVQDGIATPNEARKEFNYPELEGGNTVYMQQQDIPMSVAAQKTIHPIAEEEPDPTQDEIDENIERSFNEVFAA